MEKGASLDRDGKYEAMKVQDSNSESAVLRLLEGDVGCDEVVNFIERQVQNTKELWLLAKMTKDFKVGEKERLEENFKND